ncbi:hypothetical protein HBH56_062310 [Parastagonospora nodorum]|nr:hypothetical protein HBH56_062310 [Parastagonospora nodorum]KAH3954304.1 hypothetical protein HBH53_021190 [Parastagonospora nodorum]KAH5024243.1 hypothetical protein HBI77_018880 [Parastagonospora nodorum]KAH5073855.1 hypothetical protein HBH95_151190 [Parastagonospora nodorum]KAH6186686.1 hypothetical protein HBI68_005780 [Parastagonospora nodorum]
MKQRRRKSAHDTSKNGTRHVAAQINLIIQEYRKCIQPLQTAQAGTGSVQVVERILHYNSESVHDRALRLYPHRSNVFVSTLNFDKPRNKGFLVQPPRYRSMDTLDDVAQEFVRRPDVVQAAAYLNQIRFGRWSGILTHATATVFVLLVLRLWIDREEILSFGAQRMTLVIDLTHYASIQLTEIKICVALFYSLCNNIELTIVPINILHNSLRNGALHCLFIRLSF